MCECIAYRGVKSTCKCGLKPRPHAKLIKAWADGATIQVKHSETETWEDCSNPGWVTRCKYRIKPIPKPDIVCYTCTEITNEQEVFISGFWQHNPLPKKLSVKVNGKIKLTFDGETHQLKAVELVK